MKIRSSSVLKIGPDRAQTVTPVGQLLVNQLYDQIQSPDCFSFFWVPRFDQIWGAWVRAVGD